MRRQPWLIIAAVVTVASIEVCFHWLVSRNQSATLSAVYLPSNYVTSRADLTGLVDTVIPAASLGFVSGWVVFPNWSLRRLNFLTVGLALIVAALELFYWKIVGWHHYHGVHQPQNVIEVVLQFPFWDFVTALVVCLFFANLVYRGRRELERRS